MSDPHIICAVANGVATITINRPEKYNAFNKQTLDELDDAIIRVTNDSAVGVVVLTGAGEKAFCSGGDLEWAAGSIDDLLNLDIRANRLLMACLKPVIARVNGFAVGSGNHLAYFCDLTIASEHAIFGQNGPRVGSAAAGHYVSHAANIIGHKRAREMWMLCRRYNARQMFDWGLVNAVVPMQQLDAEVERWCRELLAMSPSALRTIKASLNDLVALTSQKDVLQRVAPHFYETGEHLEGANAFLEKRAPDFSPWRK
jgi:2-ketocyclohexanecarboxyl-CoA hydrolase